MDESNSYYLVHVARSHLINPVYYVSVCANNMEAIFIITAADLITKQTGSTTECGTWQNMFILWTKVFPQSFVILKKFQESSKIGKQNQDGLETCQSLTRCLISIINIQIFVQGDADSLWMYNTFTLHKLSTAARCQIVIVS